MRVDNEEERERRTGSVLQCMGLHALWNTQEYHSWWTLRTEKRLLCLTKGCVYVCVCVSYIGLCVCVGVSLLQPCGSQPCPPTGRWSYWVSLQTVAVRLQLRHLAMHCRSVHIINSPGTIYIQWGKKVFSQPPIVQVLLLKMMSEACNFHHRYTSTMTDKMRRKKIQKITL